MLKRGFYKNSDESPIYPKRRKTGGNYMNNGTRSISTNKYTVGWICAISTELTAATAFLDEEFDARECNLPDDNNHYVLGRICGHYVAITVLPEYGTDTAAATAKDMMRSFPSIKIRLMVGIGGGAPTPKHDIRLGDIVVSVPQNGRSGVLQYDFGKTMQNQEFQMTRVLNQPPQNLLSAVAGLRAHYESKGHLLEEGIESVFKSLPLLRETYKRPDQSSDRLYKSNVIHPLHDDRSCSTACSDAASSVVPRTKRPSEKNITIHYGLVASANQIMKDATTRDKLALQNEALCFEMEAAGLMNDFSCLVIRGICDYSDSHKNKDWQGYAAMVAAAYAKDLLSRLRPICVESSHIIPDKLESDQRDGEYRQIGADLSEMMLKSLSFEQIGARHLTIKSAHAKTCKWLFENQAYLDWLDPSKIESHHGFLWIKGKAGTGKSTLMKFALMNAKKKMKDEKIISFYFNARGADMEKCTTGMYRSLLLQLFEQLPELQSVSYPLPMAATSEGYSWNIQQLKSLFEEAVHNIIDDTVICFIDALDECDEDEIRDMVSFFQHVGEFTTSDNIKFLVCFSSRHYPHISKENALHLILEGQEGHNQDITNYLKSELKIGKSKLAEDIRASVQKKSAGIFMWVILVVEILNKEYDGGRIHMLRQRLDDIPEDLHQLFRDILTRDNYRRDELLLCIQWLLFSRQPLTPEELYFAVLSGTGPESVDGWDVDEISMGDIKKFILSSSKGLAEITTSPSPTVQFIHESVKDFLLKEKGLKEICTDFGDEFKRESHERLKHCCLQRLNRKVKNVKIPGPFHPFHKPSSSEAKHYRQQLQCKNPFLDYAVQNVFHHANAAEMDQNEQAIFFQTLNFDNWVTLHNIFERYETRQFSRKITQLYVLAIHNAGNLIRYHPSKLSCFNIEKGRYGLPVLAALVTNSHDAIAAFLEAHAHAASSEDRPNAFILRQLYEQYLQDTNKRKWVSKNFQFSRGEGILSYLVEHGDAIVISFWLNWTDVDVNLKNKLGNTALMMAVQRGYEDVVNLLLKHHADIKAKNIKGQLPQHEAAIYGYVSIVKILLEAGADALARDVEDKSPLHYAAMKGHADVVKMLIRTGVDVRKETRNGNSLLHLAAGEGHGAVVKVLLDAGADFKAKNKNGELPLHTAANARYHMEIRWSESRYIAVAELLLKDATSVNERDNRGWTPLHFTLHSWPFELFWWNKAVELLVENGADVNAQAQDGESPLHVAVINAGEDATKLLLKGGADVERKDNNGVTPLHAACLEGRSKPTKLLLESGADIEAKDKYRETPLHKAVRRGPELVELLIAHNANLLSKNNNNLTPLELAQCLLERNIYDRENVMKTIQLLKAALE